MKFFELEKIAYNKFHFKKKFKMKLKYVEKRRYLDKSFNSILLNNFDSGLLVNLPF
jgi:hypothetical protein